jgi:superfamily II DNA/RNA helicase
MTELTNTSDRDALTPDIDVIVEAPEAAPKTTTFAELGVRDEIVRALAEGGIEHTFAIQELTLPLALAGDDLIGQARTGMGKTLAFGVPLLHRLVTDETRPSVGAGRSPP